MEGSSGETPKTPVQHEDQERGAHTINEGQAKVHERGFMVGVRRALMNLKNPNAAPLEPSTIDPHKAADLGDRMMKDAQDSLPPQPQQRDE